MLVTVFDTIRCTIYVDKIVEYLLFQTFYDHPLQVSYSNCGGVGPANNVSFNDTMSLDNSTTYSTFSSPENLYHVDQDHAFHDEVPQPNTALLSLVLMLGTFFIAYFLRIFRNSKFLGRSVRLLKTLHLRNFWYLHSKLLCIWSYWCILGYTYWYVHIPLINKTCMYHYFMLFTFCLEDLCLFQARRALGDFGVVIALFLMVLLDAITPTVYTQVSDELSRTWQGAREIPRGRGDWSLKWTITLL